MLNIDFWVGVILLAVILVVAFIGPLLWGVDPYEQSIGNIFQPPLQSSPLDGSIFPIGSDQLGRDLLSRILLGAKISLFIVTTAILIAAPLGTTVGAVAGYMGGRVENIIMRLVDVQLAIPFILLVLMIVAILGSGMGNLIIVLGVTGWAFYARVARGQVLAIKKLEYIEAARAMGASHLRIIFRHLLPNILSPLIVLVSLDLSRLIILESSMGFLGLGVSPPTPTLGSLLGEGRSYLFTSWWLVVYPGLVIALLVIAFNLIGDWLIKITNTKLRT